MGLVLCNAGFVSCQSKPRPGQKHFATGIGLIKANCVDCMGGSRAGMEQGIREIEEALKEGYPDQRAANRWLLDAYNELATYTDKDPAAKKTYAEKYTETLKKLMVLSPRDPQILQFYADSLQDPNEKAPVLAKIVELNPNMSGARFELGLITAQKGKPAAGIQMIVDAIMRQGNPDELRNYVQRLIVLMDDLRCPVPDAAQWEKEMFQAYDKATIGAGDPAAMPDFRKRFLEVVRKQPCANVSK